MPPTYDQQPPFWFARAFYVGLPFGVVMMLAGVYRSLPLLLVGVVPLLAFMCASLIWSRGHKVE